MTVLPPPPPTWWRLLSLPRQLARELGWWARLRRRSWSWRVRRGTRITSWGPLRRAWVRTDPHAMRRTLEEIRRHAVPVPATAPPRAGAEARFTGPLTVGWRHDDVRLGDEDLVDWLLRELGGNPGTTGIPVEVVVRVLEDGQAPAGQGPP